MKNVAKCDTWCELQNPVNHRVFERKLRPKPLGRGHVCLGVPQCVAPPLTLGYRVRCGYWLPVYAIARGQPKSESWRLVSRQVVVSKPLHVVVRASIALGDSLTLKLH